MSDSITKYQERLEDTQDRVQQIISDIIGRDFDVLAYYNLESKLSSLMSKKFAIFGAGYVKKGNCYGTHFDVAFNVSDGDELRCGNGGNRRTIKEGTSDLGDWIYYSFDIDSGD